MTCIRRACRALIAIALPVSMVVPAAAGGAPFGAADLAAEEARFAAWSVRHGMRDAFVEFFADDSILLRPDPVNGRDYMRAQSNPPIVLDWRSSLAVLSASGDLGMSTGPWVSTSKTDPAAPAAHGQFFSVWQRQPNGQWKVLIDHGISHDKPATEATLATYDLTGSPAAAKPAGDAETGFAARTVAASAAVAYTEASTDRTRLLRAGRQPINGTAAIKTYLHSVPGIWRWQPLKQGASRAADFAYVLGTYTWQPVDGAMQQGHYIRVWVRDAGVDRKRWQLAAEVLTPRPPPPAPKA